MSFSLPVALLCYLFFKKCLLHFLLLVMLFAHVAKHSNCCSQIFFKTGVLKNFEMLIGKHLCWSLLLIKFQYWRPAFLFKNRHQHSFLEDLHFYRRPVHYPFQKFYFMIDNWCFRVKFYYCKLRSYKHL